MGAGILPVALFRGTLYILLGQERYKKAYNLWCDFGGTPNKGEKPYKTAIREGGEELNGLLGGNEKELEETVTNNMILSISYEKYTTYIFRTVFDPNLPMYFQNLNKFAETHLADKIEEHNGLFEKKQIVWFPIKQSSNNQSIEHLLKTKMIRPHYVELLKSVIKNEKFIKKEIRKLDQNHSHQTPKQTPKKNQLIPKQTQKKRKTRQRSNQRSLIKIKLNNTLKARR